MNLFILDENFEKNAQFHVNCHITKIPLEAAQILCTVRRLYGDESAKYKATHIHHPCVKWAANSFANYLWVCKYGRALCKEYTYRYGKTHACQSVINDCMAEVPYGKFPLSGLTQFVRAMPDKYKIGTVVDSYRAYYNGEKSHLFSWKNRNTPEWIELCMQ